MQGAFSELVNAHMRHYAYKIMHAAYVPWGRCRGSRLDDGGSKEMEDEWWHGGKGDDGKRKKKKKTNKNKE